MVASHHRPLDRVREPNVRTCGSSRTDCQSCQTSTFEPTIPDTDLGHHDLTTLKEFQDFFAASIKRAEALVQLSKIAKQGPYH